MQSLQPLPYYIITEALSNENGNNTLLIILRRERYLLRLILVKRV
jgi:hypothetical protein